MNPARARRRYWRSETWLPWLVTATLLAHATGCRAVALSQPESEVVHASMRGDAQRPAAAQWLRTELYFAIARAEAGAEDIDAPDWQAFLDEEVTPRFPDGFTVLDAYGQWRMRDGERIGRLLTKVMIILHPDTEAALARVEELRLAFKHRTGQDSVLRATTPVDVSF